ncbi:putative protein kinase TKL-Pl-6 family [Helianthus annuus]|nr:putative protein kinase TKL-Pl-6 family [Helianthus annuus]
MVAGTETMTPEVSGIGHVDDYTRHVSVQTGEEFSPEFLRLQESFHHKYQHNQNQHQFVYTSSSEYDPIEVDHYPQINKSDSPSGKLKFLCSFGGKILPRPSDGKLRYVGGETRIISINNIINLNYQHLINKTSSIWNQPHVIKYQLPDEDLDALVSVSSNEDLHHMIEEYNELEKSSQRLRIFLASLNEPESPSSYGSRSVDQSESDYEYVISVNGIKRQISLSSKCSSKDNFSITDMQQPAYENGQQRYSGEFPCPDLSKHYIVWEQDMITWTEFSFTPDCMGPPPYAKSPATLLNNNNKHSIIRAPSSDLISDISSRLRHITTQDNGILSSNLNENDHLEILNCAIVAPIYSHDESFEDKSLSLTSEDKNADMTEFPVLVEEVTNALPPGIPSSTKVVPCILEEPNSGIASQLDSGDVANVNSGSVTAEVEAGIHGLQIIKNGDLEELRELGSGTFGTVYHGKWRGTDVAIKRIRKSCFAGKSSEQERLTKDFWREAQMLSNLHHPNVVALYGVVPDGPGGTLSTVTEYMTNGSLKHVLSKYNSRALDWRKKLIIAQDAAIGMEYLHLKKIIHFDLKCENLLVSLGDPHRPICKVGDFGLSRIKRNTFVSGGVRGTLPWMAPELLNGSSTRVSEKVDVFSFGIAMWEILTEEEPYADMHCGAIIGGIVSNMLRPTIPEQCDERWKGLMEECWSHDPADRPTFTEITNKLQLMSMPLLHSKRHNNAKDLMMLKPL